MLEGAVRPHPLLFSFSGRNGFGCAAAMFGAAFIVVGLIVSAILSSHSTCAA
jgi:tetrahydromethanopterin S-methyltransferase subunit B